ncbi:MAG TPA: ABC transporter substrate-binding protein [Kaistiaceae bacterium]|nr:ABC transporter substrate-binding protein [Kaistiaceae bacterium]
MYRFGRILARLAFALVLAAAPALADGRPGGSLVILSTQVPRHVNGALQSGVAVAIPSTQIFASLLRYDAEGNPEPYLAESWQVSDDGLSVTLKLVAGATFHDGRPVTSEDVAFSILAIRDNHPFKSMFAPVEAVETPDPGTAVIRLGRPHPALLLALSPALAPILPKHVYGDGQDLRTHPANVAAVGAGPFRLAEFQPGEHIILKRYENFFLPGRPYLDEIVIRYLPDVSTLLLAMERGEGDLRPFATGSQEIRRLRQVDRLAVTNAGYAALGPINWLAFNTRSPKLADRRVRQAIAYAIDRDYIVGTLHHGVSVAQRGPIVEGSPFFDPTVPAYDLDLDKARGLLAEVGLGDGLQLTVDYVPGLVEQQKNLAEYLKSQLKKIGIDVTVRTSPDTATWASRIAGHDFEMTMDTVFNWGDPVIGVHRTYLSSNIRPGVVWSNTQSYADARVDALLEAAAVELDPARRKQLYAEFQQIVATDLPVYWLNLLPFHTAYDRRLGNPPLSIWGVLSPMDELYWIKDK